MSKQFLQYHFFRNSKLCNSKAHAMRTLKQQLSKMDKNDDGTIIFSRYKDYRDDSVKTIVGAVYCDEEGNKSITIFNTEKTMSITPSNELKENTYAISNNEG